MTVIKYPGWRYHPTDGARLIQNESEEADLGPGWSDSITVAPVADAPAPSSDPDVDAELEALYEAEPTIEKKAKKSGKK